MTIRYTYDGDRIIAEYGGSGTLPRKFVYGPGIDEPICLIDVADSNAVYYYGARYYDYFTGRFLQPDSLEYVDGLSLYAYVGNNPHCRHSCDTSGLLSSAKRGAYGNPSE